MGEKANEVRDKVIDSEYCTDKKDKNIKVESLKRYRDKELVAFLRARGFAQLGIEKIEINTRSGHRKTILVFCFDGDNSTRRAVIEYYNSDMHNINARKLSVEKRNVDSIIANF